MYMLRIHAAHTCCAVHILLSWVQLLDLTASLLCLQDKYTCRQHVQPKNGTEWSLQEDLRQRHVSLSLQAR